MGSYDYDTQRTNPAGVGHKNNHAATEVAETEEVKHLKSLYKNELTKLQELFPNWSEADLLFALQEGQGALEHTIDLITDGFVTQWGEVKSRKSKKEHGSKSKQGVQQPGSTQRGQRGDRGRARGEGGRGGRSTRGQRRDNRPPRQQNGTNSSNYDDTNNVTHGKARGTENTSSFRNNNTDSIGGNWNNNTNEGTNTWATDSDWSTDITGQGSSWSAENPAENVKGNWANDNTDKPQGSWNKENPTDTSKTGRNVDNTQQNVKGSWAADNSTENNKDAWVTDISTDNNIMASRDIDKATDSLKHNRDSNITKDNWDTDKDNWGVENDNLTADTSKDNWSSDTTKNGKSVKEVSRSPNAVMRSVAPTKSPVSHNLRTISPKSTTSWAQIVKPESKPEPKPEPISVPIHKNSEIVKPLSPNPVQSPPAPKVTESVVPSQELLTTPSVVTTSVSDEMEEYVRETSPEASSTSATTSATVINASPSTKEVSPPGIHKAKAGTNTRRLKQDDAAPVVMPSTGAGLERVGVQFGSLSISNNTVEESSETETQIVPQLQNTEERSVETSPQLETSPIQQQQQIVQQQAVQQLQQQQQVSQQVAQQQATQQLQQAAQQLQQPPQSSQPQSSTLSQPNPINRHPTTSTQILPSSVGSAPTGTPANAPNPTPQNFNPSYFKQQQDQSSAAYLNQQHHLGLAAEPLNGPYTSYLPNQHQPPNQISGFGIGPMQSLPAEYNAMYSPDAQRMMGYYAADPTYGQASPVTSTGYQGRDNKYTSDTATNTNSQTTNQQSTGTQQSTNQQGGQNPQQQQAYPLGVPYYPYYYMTNQFPSAAYQQSGYGQPFKSMYPMYNHPHSSKPGSVSGASPYYPTTPTTPSTPHHYSHTSNTGYEEVSGAQIHHHPVPSVLDYQKPYGSMPPLNFLGNAGSNNPQPASNTNSNVSGGKSNNSNGGSELNPPTQYKSYQDKSTNAQPTGGIGQSGTQHQQPPTNPNYYGQQFNNYQHPQTHHQYYQHQAHHQATNRNQQYWTSQS